jgi:hypothetical protein
MKGKSPVGDCALSIFERHPGPQAWRSVGAFLSWEVPERVPRSVRGMFSHRDAGAPEGRKQGS